MKKLYQYLDSNKLTSYEHVYKRVTREWRRNNCERLIEDIFSLVKVGVPKKNSIFNFVANSALSGFPMPCAEFDCRFGHLIRLSRFASLYSDTVFIQSPFDKYLRGDEFSKEDLIFDIFLLIDLRPLIENGIIQFSSEFLCVCEDCLKSISDDDNKFEEKIGIIHDVLIEEYLQNNKFYVNYERAKPYIEIKGPEKYGYHGSMVINFKKYIPDEIKEVAVKNRLVELPLDAVMETGVLSSLIDPVIDDIYKQNTYVNLYRSTYLTDRDVDVDVLNALHSNVDYKKSNNLVDGLTHIIPIIEDIPLEKIVELRVKDGEAFSVYRDAFSKTLKKSENYSVNELRDLFRDEINPELNKIEHTIKQNKKFLTGSIAKDVVFASSIISVGLYSGLLPQDIGRIMAALGGTKFAYDLYSKVGDLINTDKEIQKNSYYFLWKLQNHGRR